jgi:hypothetical protein
LRVTQSVPASAMLVRTTRVANVASNLVILLLCRCSPVKPAQPFSYFAGYFRYSERPLIAPAATPQARRPIPVASS